MELVNTKTTFTLYDSEGRSTKEFTLTQLATDIKVIDMPDAGSCTIRIGDSIAVSIFISEWGEIMFGDKKGDRFG
jgi:hypothetical protein